MQKVAEFFMSLRAFDPRLSLFSGDSNGQLHRLCGVFLVALGASETQIETSLCEAIRIAKEQKSVSLTKRAEATYAEYRRQKVSASGGQGFRLPLC
jgi:predicted sugar kinase